MAWTEINQSDNTWSDVDYSLYVAPDYWVDGYTVDTVNTWAEPQQSQNEWVVIG